MTARLYRFGTAVRKPLYYLSEYISSIALSTFLQKFHPKHAQEEIILLMQRDIECQLEPHHVALMPDHILPSLEHTQILYTYKRPFTNLTGHNLLSQRKRNYKITSTKDTRKEYHPSNCRKIISR